MPYVTQLAYSDQMSINQINELVGQLKDFLLAQSTLVSLVSDNNPPPGSGTYRVVQLNVGNSSHILRISTYDSDTLNIEFRNVAGTSNLTYRRIDSPNGLTMHLVHGTDGLALRYGTIVGFWFAKDDSGNMWGRTGSANSLFPRDSDTSYYIVASSPYKRNAAGETALLPGRCEDAEVYFPKLYAFYNQDFWPAGSILRDAAGIYYMVVFQSSASSILMEE